MKTLKLTIEQKELESELQQFSGTSEYFRCAFTGNFHYTEGIKYLAEKAQAYWLLDIIGSYQTKHLKDIFLQVWTLTKKSTKAFPEGAIVSMKEDSDSPDVIRQKIPFTDFPLNSIKLYFINNILMLPSEY